MAKTQNVRSKSSTYRPNVWGMIQNIFIAAINKGQILIFGLFLIFIVLIVKLPTEQTYTVIHEFLDLLETWHILGWILSLILTIGIVYNGKRLRKIHSMEIDRLANEKKELQILLSKRKLNTSK